MAIYASPVGGATQTALDAKVSKGGQVLYATDAPYNVPNDGTNVTAATTGITALFNDAVTTGKPIKFGPGTYATNTITNTSTSPIKIIGDHAKILSSGYWTFKSTEAGALTLNASMARSTRVMTVTSTTGVSAGDLVTVVTSIIAETDRSRFRRQTFTVASVDSGTALSTVELSNFPFAPGDSGLVVTLIHTPRRVDIEGLDFEIVSASNSIRAFGLDGTSSSRISNVTVTVDNPAIDPSLAADGIMVDKCVDTTLRTVRFVRGRYGVVPQQSNRTVISDITMHGGRHAVVPAYFADGVYVTMLRGENNVATVDSHEAFEVHYRDVISIKDSEVGNIRSCGGSLRDARCDSTSTTSPTLMQNIGFVAGDATLYTLHDFTVDNVEWSAPLGLSISKGRVVTVNNVRLTNDKRLALSAEAANQITEARVSNTNYDNSVNGNIRCPLNLSTDKWGAAALNSGVYEIRPARNSMGSNGAAMLKQSGLIFIDSSTSADPRTISVRVFTDPTPSDNTTAATYVLGLIKFTAGLRHTNSGLFDITWAEYHFQHKKKPTTSVTMPTTSASTAGLTGHTNESLAITIGNITQSSYSSTVDGRADYIQFDVTLTSGRTNPVYSLMYELTILGN